MNKNWRFYKNLASRAKADNAYGEAIDHLKIAIQLALGEAPGEVAVLYNGLASIYLKDNELKLSEDAARQSIMFELEFRDAVKENTNLADYYNLLSKVLEKQGRFAEAYESIEKGVGIFIQLLGADNDYVKGILKHCEELKGNTWRG